MAELDPENVVDPLEYLQELPFVPLDGEYFSEGLQYFEAEIPGLDVAALLEGAPEVVEELLD